MNPRILAFVCALMMAGCFGDSGSSGGAKTTGLPTASVTAETGGVQGLVLDEEMVPVRNATVLLIGTNQTAQTGDSGAFAFGELEPMTYLLVAKSPGYKERSLGVDVVAGTVTRTRVIIERIPPPVPYLDQSYTYAGYLPATYAARVAGVNVESASSSGNVIPEQLRTRNAPNVPLLAGWTGVLVEVEWKPAYQTADRMRLRADLPNKTSGGGYQYSYRVTAAEGPSPLKFRLDNETFAQHKAREPNLYDMIGTKTNLIMWSFAAPASNGVVGLHLDQRFTLYATVAYLAELPPQHTRLAS